MRLRNKKTGEVKFVELIKMYGVCPANFGNYKFNSLAELNEEWEDYKPTEPLIKDPKIRNAVRAWAEAVGVDKVIYQDISGHYVYFRTELDEYEHTICINFWHKLNADLCSGTTYTITELCGEEEE